MKLHDATMEELHEAAKTVAAKYKSRCKWADFDDLFQEAWVAIVLASRSFNPERGTPFAGYAMSGGFQYTRTFVWQSGSPVHAGRNHLEQLQGVTKASTDVLDTSAFAVTPGTDEARMASAQRDRQLDAIIALALQGDSRIELDYRVLMELVSGDAKPKEVAEEVGCAVSFVTQQRQLAADLLSSTPELFQIWRDR